MDSTKVDFTPSQALYITSNLSEQIPQWISRRGGLAALYEKLGYTSARAAQAALSRRKKTGWNQATLIRWLEVIVDTPEKLLTNY